MVFGLSGGLLEVHFEILVEDVSGKKALETLVPKIIENNHTFKIHAYKGIGSIPRNLKNVPDPSKRILLNNLPRLLNGYGKTFEEYPKGYRAVVIVVCDLDDRDRNKFLQELNEVLNTCQTKPDTKFCLAIEEGEAWFLGDIKAIKAAYPNANSSTLAAYKNDSICGTWETLADAVFSGGVKKLREKGRQAIGAEKSKWASEIPPHMNIESNLSPSFCVFRDELRALV